MASRRWPDERSRRCTRGRAGSRSNESTGIHAKTFTPAGFAAAGDKIKEIGPDRQLAVGEIERPDPAVALRVGKRLQENMADFHVVDPLDQPVDILGLLGRIRS